MMQCLITLRLKAEHLQHPARDSEAYGAQQKLCAAIASAMRAPPYAKLLGELGPSGPLVLEPEGAQGPRGLLNSYWLAEGAVSLAWLLGLLPSLPSLPRRA